MWGKRERKEGTMERERLEQEKERRREAFPVLSSPKYYAPVLINFPSPPAAIRTSPRYPLSGPPPAGLCTLAVAPGSGDRDVESSAAMSLLQATHRQSPTPQSPPPLLRPPCIPLAVPQSVPNAQSLSTLQNRSVFCPLSAPLLPHDSFG